MRPSRPEANATRRRPPWNPCAEATMNPPELIANGRPARGPLPCSLEVFLAAQNLPPRSVVVEHNGEAVAPSEFPSRQVQAGDRLEIVRIVAGG